MRRLALLPLIALAVLGGACAERGCLVIRQGQPLSMCKPEILPGSPTPVPPAPAFTSVKVEPGESLWTLSERWLGTGFRWREIAAANHLASPWDLTVGQRIEIPIRPGTALAAASATGMVKAAARLRPEDAAVAYPEDDADRYGWKKVPNGAFTVGEKLTFAVQYGGMTAGYATLSIPGLVTMHGRPAFHILAEAQSQPFFNAIFKVHDFLDSYIDVDYGFSWGYEKHLHEGHFISDAVYDYDQRRGLILEPAKNTQEPMPIGSQDVLSCFYYFRTQPMVVGSTVHMSVTADDKKSYQLVVNVLRKERVSTLAGTFDCVVVQPHLFFNGVFRQRADVFLWITDDERRLPVLIRSKIIIGSININLQNAQWVRPAPGASND